MENFIVAGVVLIIVGTAIFYIRKEKKKGVKCIGCPMAGKCPSQNGGHCSSKDQSNTKE